MSEYIMNRESLKQHCEAMCRKFRDVPTSGTYGEHRLVLDLLEQTEWIPVSERLPEEFESVLVCYKSQGGMAQCVSERLVNMDGSNRWSAMYGQEPIAWMPLPQPYKAESDPWEKWLYPNRKENKE